MKSLGMQQAYRGWTITFDPRRPGDKVWRGVNADGTIVTAVSKGGLKRKIDEHAPQQTGVTQ